MRKNYFILVLLGFIFAAVSTFANAEYRLQNISKADISFKKDKPKRMNMTQAKKKGLLPTRKTFQLPPSKAYQPKQMFGYLVYDDELRDLTLCSFSLDSLSTINIIDMGPEYYPDLACGAYGNGLYYYYGCDGDGYAMFFASVDLASKDRNIINDYELEDYFLAYDMTYDYSTNTMYALVSMDDGDTSSLATVDLTNGSIEPVTTLEDYYVALAATYEGDLYAISLDGVVYKIDKQDGSPELILDTGIASDYLCTQSMEFDHTDESLYWASYAYHEDRDFYESALIKINVKDKTKEEIGVIGTNAEICGLYIPFVRNSLDSPLAPSEVTLVPDPNGGNTADLSWKNPEKTLNEDPLTALTKIELYRNDDIIKTFENPVKGETLTFKDTDVPTGLYTYKIIAYNTAGDGLPATITGFIGHDVPAAVSNLTLTKVNERTGKLTWEAPDKGLNGGWIDLPSLSYTITRLPDNKIVANDYKENEFTDKNITSLNNYSYIVESVTTDGKGGRIESNKELLGKALTIPYETSFGEEEQGQWTIIDANKDEKTWTYDTLLADFFFKDATGGVFYFGNSKGDTDDWLISSPLTFESGKSYKLEINAQVSTKGEDAILEITAGKGSDINDHQIITTLHITAFSPETKTISIIGLESGDYTLGMHLKLSDSSKLRIARFGVDTSTASYLSGIVKCGQELLKGASVQVKDSNNAIIAQSKTDAKGQYTLPYIEKGEYTLVTTLAGYDTVERALIISDPEIITVDIEMVKSKTVTIKGTVKNEKDLPLAGVSVAFRGTLNYQATTTEEGSFTVENIAVGNYRMTFYKNAFEQYTSNIDITEDKTLDAIILTNKILPPSDIQATADKISATISWKEPVEYKTFRYDNGKQTKNYGINGGNAYGVMGNLFRQPAKLTSASWYTIYDGYDDHDFVNLFVFDLDANGEPTNHILFAEPDIKNNNGEWTTYAFETPIDCPNGFIIALSVNNGYLALGATEEDEEYPFIPETQCSTQDYEHNVFYYMEELGFNDNLMVRAEGIPTGAPSNQAAKITGINKQKSKPIDKPFVIHREPTKLISPTNKQKRLNSSNDKYPAYNVYRLKDGEEKQTEKWTLLTPQPVMTLTYTDQALSTLPQGYYKYAVKAVYTSNRLSEAIISNVIGQNVLTDVTIAVQTNVEGVSAEKASIKLSNDKNSYTAAVDASGKATFIQIEKGIYQLTAKLKGCKEYTQEIDCLLKGSYNFDIQLTENLISPHNLAITPTTGNKQYQLSWNEFTITDDFENHKNFEINSPGEIGWNYIDGDGSKTKAFKDGQTGEWYEFDNMFSPMAFIVFNPSAVMPAMDDFHPHSGNKFLACIAGEVPNDDYLISPELDGSDSFIFKFFALSYDGSDQMKVGYSFNGMEAEDFIWDSGTISLTTPKEWKEYSYEIPGGAKFAAVRCISPDPLIFMIDDVCITTDKEKSCAAEKGLGAHTYEIYLDGKKVITQRGITYTFTNIADGKHIAGVKAIYASGESELATVEFEVTGNRIEEVVDEEVLLYPNPAKERIFVKGQVEQLDIYGASGNLLGSYLNPTEIQVAHLNDGIYTFRMITENGIQVKKVVIRK